MKFPSFKLHLSICRKERSGSKALLQMPELRSKTAWFGCCVGAPKSVGRKFSISHSWSFLFLGTPALIGKLSFEMECGRYTNSRRSLNSFFFIFLPKGTCYQCTDVKLRVLWCWEILSEQNSLLTFYVWSKSCLRKRRPIPVTELPQ